MGADERDEATIPALALLYVLWTVMTPLSLSSFESYIYSTHLGLETVRSVKYPSHERSCHRREAPSVCEMLTTAFPTA